jgi:glutathionyl-hydroquinone reductase
LNRAFDQVGGDAKVDLYPAALQSDIDHYNSRINRSLATAVYAVAAARDQAE